MIARLPWTPGTGDLVWVRMAVPPVSGGGCTWRRPAVVLSPAAFSARTRLALVCPVVDEAKGYPFEVALPRGLPVSGVILADRVTSLDLGRCPVRLLATVPDDVVTAVRQRLLPLVAAPAT